MCLLPTTHISICILYSLFRVPHSTFRVVPDDRRDTHTVEGGMVYVGGIWRVACGMCDVACGIFHVACKMWHVACGMWHVACGMRHVTCGKWKVEAGSRKVECFDVEWNVERGMWNVVCEGSSLQLSDVCCHRWTHTAYCE